MIDESKWNQSQAIDLCVLVEAICPEFGCHVALTGGCLYRTGPRKDCDLLFYRIRQSPEINQFGLFEALEKIGFTEIRGLGWCWKASYEGRNLDLFFPEQSSGDYTPEEIADRNECLAEVRFWRDIRNDRLATALAENFDDDFLF